MSLINISSLIIGLCQGLSVDLNQNSWRSRNGTPWRSMVSSFVQWFGVCLTEVLRLLAPFLSGREAECCVDEMRTTWKCSVAIFRLLRWVPALNCYTPVSKNKETQTYLSRKALYITSVFCLIMPILPALKTLFWEQFWKIQFFPPH